MRISESTESKTWLGEGKVGVGSCKKVRRDGSRSRTDDGEVDGNEVGNNEVGKKVQRSSKSKNLSKFKKTVGLDFLTPRAKLAFTELKQAFVKAPIFHHFDLERHIRIKTDASSYAIGGVLSQLTSDDLGQWQPVAFFFRKMILAEIRYETYDSELLAIIEVFKTWMHYLEGL